MTKIPNEVFMTRTKQDQTEMEKSRSDVMRETKRKLEDILNSQESLIEKMAQIEVDLLNHPDKELETELSDIHTDAANSYEKIFETLEKYTTRLNSLM